MKHYCRYCTHCIAEDENIGYCEKRDEAVKKTSMRNACSRFEFLPVDAFYFDRSDNPHDARYRPREKKKECDGQLKLNY